MLQEIKLNLAVTGTVAMCLLAWQTQPDARLGARMVEQGTQPGAIALTMGAVLLLAFMIPQVLTAWEDRETDRQGSGCCFGFLCIPLALAAWLFFGGPHPSTALVPTCGVLLLLGLSAGCAVGGGEDVSST